MKWFDNQHHNKASATTLPFQLHRVNDKIYDEIIKRNDEYFLIKRCGVMPFTGVHNFTEFVTDGYTLVYPLPRSQQQEIKLDWTPPRTQGDFTTFVINSGSVSPQIEGTLAIDRRYQEWRESKQGQTIMVAPFNIDYNREVYVDKIHGSEQPVGELVIDDEGNESYELAINTIESPNLKTYEGVTHVSSHGQILSPHMEIQAKQMIDGEEVLSSFEGKNITISDSAMGEIESATLYGETLVNVIKEPKAEIVLPYSFEESEFVTIEGTKETGSLGNVVLKGQTLTNIHPTGYSIRGGGTTHFAFIDVPRTMVEPNTKYFLRLYNTHQSIVRAYFKPCINPSVNLIAKDNKCAIFTTKSKFTDDDFINNKIHFYSSSSIALEDVKNTKILLCEYQDGMENWDIPYFEGMKSVQMPVLRTTGKNLIKLDSYNLSYKNVNASSDGKMIRFNSQSHGSYCAFDLMTGEGISQIIGADIINIAYAKSQTLIEGKGSYTLSLDSIMNTSMSIIATICVVYDDGAYKQSYLWTGHKKITVEVQNKINFISIDFWYEGASFDITLDNIQLELGSTDSTYEPHKATILKTPQDLTLREINGLQDTLDLTTGKATMVVSEEVIFNGSDDEGWSVIGGVIGDSLRFRSAKGTLPFAIKGWTNGITLNCDKLKVTTHIMWGGNGSPDCIYQDSEQNIIITKSKDTTLNDFKTWLKQNPITVQYELATPVVEKVDLSIVDQNGVKKDKLQTFNGVTHLVTSVPVGSLNPIISHQPLEIPATIKADTQYSIIKDSYTNGHDNVPFTLDLGGEKVSPQIGERVTLVTTPKTLAHNSLKPSGWGQKLTNLMIIEGDHTESDIPYIEGMQSVEAITLESCGKNLWSQEINNGYPLMTNNDFNRGSYSTTKKPVIRLAPNTGYKIVYSTTEGTGADYNIWMCLKTDNQPSGGANGWGVSIDKSAPTNKEVTLTTGATGELFLMVLDYMRDGGYVRNANIAIPKLKIHIEEIDLYSGQTEHESNRLILPENTSLRRVGEIRDTFDTVNGVLTQSVFEMVLNDTSIMNYNGKTNEVANFDINPSRQGLPLAKKGTKCVVENNHDNIAFGTTSNFLKLQLHFNNELPSSSTIAQIKEYLSSLLQSSPIKVQYIAQEPVMKTVVIGNGEDLSLDETKVKLPRPLGKNEALEWNSSANHYQIIGYENGVKSVVEDCKELLNRYVIPLRDKVKTFVTSTASKLSLDLPYRKIRELIVPENFTIVLDNENDLITASWDKVVGATDYDVYLDGVFLARVNTNQYQRKEEIKGHLKVRAVNNLTKSAFTEEIYVLSVPNETFISLVENRYENGHVFTVTFADYSEIETGFRVRWSPDGREESYADVEGVTGVGTVIKYTFTVPLVQDYIDIRVNSYNETGENPIVPPIHLEMSPTPMWTYKEVLGQVMLQWDNTINNTEHYVLKYRIDGTDEYVYDTILSNGLDTLTGYIELGEKELAEVSLAGVVNGLTHVYCKPFKVGKSIDESLLPPQNFTYRAISESEFEFSWTDSYTCEREFELTLSHSDGRIERIIVPSTSSSTAGRRYTHRYKLQEHGYFGVKMRMNWELGNSEYTQEYTIYYLPTIVEPPAYLRKERRESEVSLQWEAQSYVDHYALHLSINGDEVEYEVKNNHYEFKINFEEEPEIRAYVRTHFLDGKVSSSSSILRFRPCYSPNPYTAIMVNTVEEEKVLDCNITSPNVAQYYPLYTGSKSSTEVSYLVTMSSVTKFTMIESPLTTEFWGKSLETVGHIMSYICRSGVEQSQYPLSTLTYKPTKSVIPILETIFLNYVYEALVNTEINPVRITTIGDSITAGHPNHWAETGTGDVRSQYQYWLNRKLNGQYEILNKGYGSDTTDKMVARFDKDVLETHPQYCIIQGGTNDLYWAMAESNGDQTALDRKLEVMKSNITQMVQKCIANNIIPIVGTLIPRTGATGIYQKALFDYNDWIIQYCNELETAYYVDFFNAGKNNIPPTPLEDPTNRGALNPIYDGDAIYDEYGNLIKQGRGIHPNIEGYKIMADSIPTSIFQSQDGGLKLYLDSECTREEELDTSDKMNPFYTISIEGARRGKPKTFVRYVKNAGIGQVLYAMYHTNPHNINVRFINDKGETRPHGNGLLPSGHSHPVYIEVTPLTHDSVSKIDLHLAGREFKTKS